MEDSAEEKVTHIVAVSGGKDSTALAILLAEKEPRDYTYLITPTGDELPDMVAHWENLEKILGKPFVRVTSGTLNSWIEHYGSLPNWRQRWCTRRLKIEPCIEFVKQHSPAILYVGLRADEEERQGIYSELVDSRFPLREWGMGLAEVIKFVDDRGIKIPKRTDCARCYGQRLGEWRDLWKNYPEIYADAIRQEEETGATFRSPGRDKWPASLVDLAKEFEKGRKVRGDGNTTYDSCRVCRL